MTKRRAWAVLVWLLVTVFILDVAAYAYVLLFYQNRMPELYKLLVALVSGLGLELWAYWTIGLNV